MSDISIVVHFTVNIYIKNIIFGKFHLKYPPPYGPSLFPIYVTVRIISVMVAELIIQVNIYHVVIVELADAYTVKRNLE